jgi:hypothetical protein
LRSTSPGITSLRSLLSLSVCSSFLAIFISQWFTSRIVPRIRFCCSLAKNWWLRSSGKSSLRICWWY